MRQNEDCGQMSAWYIFSAMGFYPVNPVSGEYVVGSWVVNFDGTYLVTYPTLAHFTRKSLFDYRQFRMGERNER